MVKPPTPHTYLNDDRSARDVAAGERLRIGYAGAGAAAVLDGRGKVDVLIDDQRIFTLELDGPRLYELYETGMHEEHELTLMFDTPARAYAFSFTPGPA